MKKIYLDVCSLCRPFDNQNFTRIKLETDSTNLILSGIRDGYYQMIKSPVHYKEIMSITDDFERIELLNILDNYGLEPEYSKSLVRKRAEDLIHKNFGIADAAHVAFSEFFNSTFISCDDKLLNICSRFITKIQCVNPVLFCEMEKLI